MDGAPILDLTPELMRLWFIGFWCLLPLIVVETIAARQERSRPLASGIIALLVMNLLLRIVAMGPFDIMEVARELRMLAPFSRTEFLFFGSLFVVLTAYLFLASLIAGKREIKWTALRLLLSAPFLFYPAMAFYNMQRVMVFPEETRF